MEHSQEREAMKFTMNCFRGHSLISLYTSDNMFVSSVFKQCNCSLTLRLSCNRIFFIECFFFVSQNSYSSWNWFYLSIQMLYIYHSRRYPRGLYQVILWELVVDSMNWMIGCSFFLTRLLFDKSLLDMEFSVEWFDPRSMSF